MNSIFQHKYAYISLRDRNCNVLGSVYIVLPKEAHRYSDPLHIYTCDSLSAKGIHAGI